MSTRNDVEIEEKTESSNLQQVPSDEVEADDEATDYGSTFESFRSKDDDDQCLLEREESEKKKKMTTSNQQHTVEKDEVSSDEVVMDDGCTIGPLQSSPSLSVSEYRWDPCLEVEEYDEGFVVFSRSSSSTSSLSSFSRSQPPLHPIKMRRPTFFKSLLGVPRRVIGKPSLITPPMMISHQDEFKIFTKKELRKVTNNFSLVIGNGVNGEVYKGILDDQRVVAVKKELKEFVNARINILSQINHVNVVKLLGFCLEVKPPMLVYEYIPNGSLLEFIHNLERSVEFPLDTRLRMAAEAAEALVYLHSGASPPILHGNVKSSNILLDENYTVKVNYKGWPKPIIQGTYVYLDPECLHRELTDKSDVYSFGVVLLELLTRREEISGDFISKEHWIETRFIDFMRENKFTHTYTFLDPEFRKILELTDKSDVVVLELLTRRKEIFRGFTEGSSHLLDILDPEITTEGLTEQLQKVTNLVARCLKEKGSDRPTMKEVHMELEASRVSTTCPLVRVHTIESQEM